MQRNRALTTTLVLAIWVLMWPSAPVEAQAVSCSIGTSRYSATSVANTNVNVTIYGRIPARQDAAVGAYTDTITGTITF